MKIQLFIVGLILFFISLSAQTPAGYKIINVPLPRGSVSVLGLCHKPDDTLAICTWEGEVWERKGEVWTRFAENLMEPNGIYYDAKEDAYYCLLYTSPSPRDQRGSRMPSSA